MHLKNAPLGREINQDRAWRDRRIAFGNIKQADERGNLRQISDMTPDAAAMIAGFECCVLDDGSAVKKVKINDRQKRLR